MIVGALFLIVSVPLFCMAFSSSSLDIGNNSLRYSGVEWSLNSLDFSVAVAHFSVGLLLDVLTVK